jgi:cobalt-zinc-cadmium resistance protein CzcA
MLQKLIAAALRLPSMILLLALILIGIGLYSYKQLDIEAYPNPVPPLVEVITQPNGWSAEEVERYVTIPLEVGLSGMPGLDHIRSQSLFGLSDIKCYFKWGIEYKDARQEVINRLQFVGLPQGVQPQISPWNAIGEVFRYSLRGAGYSLKDLKTAQDFTLERQFRQVAGVIDVVSFGGETKQFQVSVDPLRMRGQGVTLPQIMNSIQNANINVGGQRLVLGEQSYDVRGIGLLKTRSDIENIVITEHNGIPVRVRDIGDATIGAAPRLGLVGRDDEGDVVQGIVLMRYGGETQPTLEALHEKLEEIRSQHLLPPGMEIVPYYDRGALVKITTHTVIENLVVGMVLVTLVLFLFLGHTRAALITALNIPMALMVAFSGMVITGTPANLISLGAVDFGIVVDSTVIMTENIFRHLGSHGRGSILQRIMAASSEVGGPMAFSTLIIGTAFLPLFTMTGVSGVIFAPMARTYAFAIGGAVLLALTLTPVLTSKFIPAQSEEKESAVMHFLNRLYAPAFHASIKYPRAALGLAVIPVVLCAVLYPLLGGEFMPKLEEGNFWIRATLPMSISLEQSTQYVGRMRQILRGCPTTPNTPCTDQNRSHPEIVTVVSQLGRPDDGTDVSGFFNIELFAPLAPFDTWRRGLTKEILTEQLAAELRREFPGVVFNFSQMISDNVEEALSGVKGENSIKVAGPSLEVNETNANEIVDVLEHIRGVQDLGLIHSLGQPSVQIQVDRASCARYGLNTGDVEAVVQAAIGGQVLTQVYEGEKHFDLVLRLQPAFRSSITAMREITVPTPAGAQIPLGQLASITRQDGAAIVYREDGHRYTPIKFSVRGRDLKSAITEAQQKIHAKVKLPYDTHLLWGGQMNEMRDAMGRLMIIIPLTLLLIGMLVYAAVHTWYDTAIVLLSIPVACTGGVLALLITRINFSVSAAMGFISIFGVAIQDAILVVTYFQRLRAGLIHGGSEDPNSAPVARSIEDAALEAAVKRFRPVLMTTLVATLGLLPAAISNGIGAQTQKPLAVVVIGGSLILALLTQLLHPPLLVVIHRWQDRKRHARPALELASDTMGESLG